MAVYEMNGAEYEIDDSIQGDKLTETLTQLSEIGRPSNQSTETISQAPLPAVDSQQTIGLPPDLPQAADVPRETGLPTTENLSSGLNEGLARTLGLPVDAVTSAINQTITNFGGTAQINDPIGGAKFLEDIFKNLGVIGPEPTTEEGKLVRRTAQEVGAGILPGVGIASKAIRPIRALAGEIGLSAVGGAAAGKVAEEGGGEVAQLAAQAITPLSVSAVPTLAKGAVRRVVRGKTPKTVQETIETFAESEVSPSVGQATQRRAVQNLETLMSKAPGGGTPFFIKATETVKGIQARVNTIADRLSKGSTPEKAGRAIKRSIIGFTDDFKSRAGVLYDKLDEAIPKETAVSVNNTKSLLDELAAPIPGAEKTTTGIVTPFIRKMQQDLTEDAVTGTLPYGALKIIRSRIGEKLTSELIVDASKAQLKRVYGAISKDMEKAATDMGVLETFKRANKFWKAGLSRIDDFLEPLAKKVQPEDIFIAATKGREGATRVRAVIKGLNTQEKDMVASAVLRRMGKAIPSAQGGLSEKFSTETFLSNWATLSPQAKSVLFSGTPKLKAYSKNIDQIVRTTSIIREGSRALANPSGTSSQFANFLTAGLAAGGIIDPKFITLAGTVFVGSNQLARLMTSDKFVKFLADTTRFPVNRLPGLVTRLSVEIQNENIQLQKDVQEYLSVFIKENNVTIP